MTPAPVHGSVNKTIAPPSASSYALLASQPSSAEKLLRSRSPAMVNQSWCAEGLAIEAHGGEHEARRRWQLHQQQNSALSYRQKIGVLYYQADQYLSPLASLHIEV
jgi:hypothetical protein